MDNFIIDYILIRLLGFTFKDRYLKKNTFFSCGIGTISAIFLPFLMNLGFLLYVYKILTAFLMVLVLKKYKSYRQYFMLLIMFFIYTLIFGGCAIAILNMFNINYTMSGLLLYNCEFPVSLFIIIFGLDSWLFKRVILAINKQFKTNNYIYKIKLIDNGKVVEGVGFYDSGNKVSRNGNGVSIISIDMFLSLYEDYSVDKLIFRNIDFNKLKHAEYIDIGSLSKSSKYLSFIIDEMFIENEKFKDVVVAVALKNFQDFDCIINSYMLGGFK
jgi:hypothetical protein